MEGAGAGAVWRLRLARKKAILPSPAAGNAEAAEPPKGGCTKRPRELGHSVRDILVLFREIDVATKTLDILTFQG